MIDLHLSSSSAARSVNTVSFQFSDTRLCGQIIFNNKLQLCAETYLDVLNVSEHSKLHTLMSRQEVGQQGYCSTLHDLTSVMCSELSVMLTLQMNLKSLRYLSEVAPPSSNPTKLMCKTLFSILFDLKKVGGQLQSHFQPLL